MGFEEIVRMLVGGLIGGITVGLPMYLKANRQVASHGAEQSAISTYKQTIVDLKQEWKDQRERDREKFSDLLREYTEFRNETKREFGYVRQFNRATQSDIKKVNHALKGDSVERLDTQILDTQFPPLG